MVTCKLIFEFGVTKERVAELLKKYTPDGKIATFVPDLTVGCNRLAFAVVDVPDFVMPKLFSDDNVREVDPLGSYTKPYSTAESCGSGCGCGP